MNELYLTQNAAVHEKLEKLLSRHITGAVNVLRTPLGKPYLEGDPLYFSVSHSGGRAAIAICDKPVGVDLQIFTPVGKYPAVLERFFASEREYIGGDGRKFARVWAMKEAFEKMRGGSIFADFKRVEVRSELIFFDGEPQNCKIYCDFLPDAALAVCVDGSFAGDMKDIAVGYI